MLKGEERIFILKVPSATQRDTILLKEIYLSDLRGVKYASYKLVPANKYNTAIRTATPFSTC